MKKVIFILFTMSSVVLADVTWRYYDSAVDGPVNLSEVRVLWNRFEPNWGDLEIAGGTAYPVWQKSETENIVLTTESMVRYGLVYTAPGRPGKWSEVNDNTGGQWFSKDGRTLFFSMARLIPVYPPVSVPYDNLHYARRQMVVWRTHDGIHWEPGYFDTPSEFDEWGYQHYGMSVRSLEQGNLYEAILRGYHAGTQQVFLEVAHSRDGIYWQRFEGRPPFAENSPPGGFAFGFMNCSNETAVQSNEYEFLFLTASNAPHFALEVIQRGLSDLTTDSLWERFKLRRLEEWPYWDAVLGSWEGFSASYADAAITVGVARHRKDGKVSLGSEDDTAGIVVTKVLYGASTVGINAETAEDGAIYIEVLDADGNEIEEYSGSNSACFSGNETDHTLKWKNGTLETLPQEPFKLRIRIEDAELYALNWK